MEKTIFLRQFFLTLLQFWFISGWSQSSCSEPDFSGQTSLTNCSQFSNCGSTYSPVAAVGEPYIYEGECTIGLNRYLSRAIDAGFISELINGNAGDLNCNEPTWGSRYCPEKYCALIQSFIDMDVQMIQRAYPGAANREHQFFSGDDWFELGAQIVRDINHAYDCAGKQRPIIQGGVFEFSNPGNFPKMLEFHNNLPNGRNIPCWVIQRYFERYPLDLEPQNISRYFTDSNHTMPANNVFFEASRMYLPDSPGVMDITSVETRIWFLYQAWSQIKMGYTAIHMGIYWSYGRDDQPDYSNLYKLTNEIRAYATENNSFVLLSGETPMQNVDNGMTAIHNGHFIFDIDSRAMRPREISGDLSGDGFGCNSPVNASLVSAWNNSPCANIPGVLGAVVDYCTINSFGGGGSNGSFEHPLGCNIPMLPYTIHFDGFALPTEPGTASGGPSSLTYGFNDHQWFASLPDACKIWWYDYFYCHVAQNFHNGMGHIVIPGIIAAMDQESSNNYTTQVPMTYHLINETPGFVENLANNTLAPQVPELTIEELPSCNEESSILKLCNGNVGCFYKDKQKYKISIKNKDCSSIYSIHVKMPNGQWMPQKIGTEYIITPPMSGEYIIGVRQDNLAIQENFGVYTNDIKANLARFCCKEITDIDVIERNCPTKFINFSTNCVERNIGNYKHEFVIESGDVNYSISNPRNAPLQQYQMAISSYTQVSPTKIEGVFYSNEEDTQANFLVDVYDVLEDQSFDWPLNNTLVKCQGRGDERSASFNDRAISGADIQVYPNPANDVLFVDFARKYPDGVNINIYDANSRCVVKIHLTADMIDKKYTLDISALNNGVYIVEIESSEESKTFKLTVLK